jgi:hypothetical protein
MSFEYKCVGAPERPKRQRGASRSERVAIAMQEIINVEAVDGWEYLRTDLVPVEEKAGLFSRTHEVHRAVLVFRREIAQSHGVRPISGLVAAPDPELTSFPDDRGERDGREARIRLSAERGAPLPSRANRPPSGLG